jgi:hypothetical protein
LSWNSTCFGQFVCPSSGVYSLYTQQWYMSYRFVDSFRAGRGWNCSSIHGKPPVRVVIRVHNTHKRPAFMPPAAGFENPTPESEWPADPRLRTRDRRDRPARQRDGRIIINLKRPASQWTSQLFCCRPALSRLCQHCLKEGLEALYDAVCCLH